MGASVDCNMKSPNIMSDPVFIEKFTRHLIRQQRHHLAAGRHDDAAKTKEAILLMRTVLQDLRDNRAALPGIVS